MAADADGSGDGRRIQQRALLVGEHGPKAAQRFRGNSRTQEGNVPFKISADKLLAPLDARGLVRRQKAVGKTAPQPKSVPVAAFLGRDLLRQQRSEFRIGDAAGQGFGRLLEKIDRRRAQQEKLPVAATLAAALVDDAAQDFEKSRHALDFVQHDQAVFLGTEIELRIGELCPMRRQLEIQIDGRGPKLLDEPPRQGCLADLTRAQHGDGRKTREQVADTGFGQTVNHTALLPCRGIFAR